MSKPDKDAEVDDIESSKQGNDSQQQVQEKLHQELVDMRGVGRYFGVEEENLGIVCRNCHERGHIAADCTVVICDTCGERDDHYSKQCPRLQRCSNCGESGHLRSVCTNRAKYIFCSRCDSRNHTENMCPQIWRSYRINRGATYSYPKSVSCSNCGREGHYGDDCLEARPVFLRFREDSAFNGNNLPGRLKDDYARKSAALKKRANTIRSEPNQLKARINVYNDYYESGEEDYADRWRRKRPRLEQEYSLPQKPRDQYRPTNSGFIEHSTNDSRGKYSRPDDGKSGRYGKKVERFAKAISKRARDVFRR